MDYISTADTAKAIRLVLRETFPKVKFSVRSHVYSGGSAIRISWIDGPTTKAVDEAVGVFRSKGFDGSIDLGYSISHYALPSGKIVGTRTSGTAGSGGYVSAHDDGPIAGATLVTYSAGYVTTDREISLELRSKLETVLRTELAIASIDLASRYHLDRAEELLALG